MNINIKTKYNIGDKVYILVKDDGKYNIREELITGIYIKTEQKNEWDKEKEFPVKVQYSIGFYCHKTEEFVLDDIKKAKRLCNKLNKFLNYL